MFAFCGARSIFYILLQITTYRIQTSFCSTLGWIASRFYNILAVLRHWCKCVCICCYNNCEHNDIQPMIESHPCFTVYTPCFALLLTDVRQLWITQHSTYSWITSQIYSVRNVFEYYCWRQRVNRKYYSIQPGVESHLCFTVHAACFVLL